MPILQTGTPFPRSRARRSRRLGRCFSHGREQAISRLPQYFAAREASVGATLHCCNSLAAAAEALPLKRPKSGTADIGPQLGCSRKRWCRFELPRRLPRPRDDRQPAARRRPERRPCVFSRVTHRASTGRRFRRSTPTSSCGWTPQTFPESGPFRGREAVVTRLARSARPLTTTGPLRTELSSSMLEIGSWWSTASVAVGARAARRSNRCGPSRASCATRRSSASSTTRTRKSRSRPSARLSCRSRAPRGLTLVIWLAPTAASLNHRVDESAPLMAERAGRRAPVVASAGRPRRV
jgi:hypothetical protein